MARTKQTKTSSNKTTGRPKPLVPKAGYTPGSRRRYPNGGKVSK